MTQGNAVTCHTFLSWNIRSLKRRFIDLLYFVKQKRPSVICIQEALHNTQSLNIRGYIKYEHTTNQGLVTYFKKTIPHELIECSDTNNQMNTYMLFKVNDPMCPYHLCNVYSKTNTLDFEQLPSPTDYDSLIYMGDFNARHLTLEEGVRARTNKNGRTLIDFCENFQVGIVETSKTTHIAGGRLDYVLVNNINFENIKAETVSYLLSDHYALYCTYVIPSSHGNYHRRRRINVPKHLTALLCERVTHWYETYIPTSVQEFHDNIVNITQNFHDDYLGGNKPTMTSNKKNWTHDNRLQSLEQEILKLAEDYKDDESAENLNTYFTKLREFRELKENVREEHFMEFLQSINKDTNIGRIWKEINLLVGKKTQPVIRQDAVTAANELLDKYAEISSFDSLPNEVQQRLIVKQPQRENKIKDRCRDAHASDDYPITQWELNKALSHGRSTAPGEDGITYEVLRLLNMNTNRGNPLLDLFNLSLDNGELPSQWTSSMIIPIPKQDTDQTRPISLTSCMCKVLERIILNRLRYIVGDKLHKKLYGFLTDRSTRDCFADYIASTTSTTVTTFVDLKAAFDKANKTVILERLTNYGVKGKILKWIMKYLSNRKARVYYGGYLTEREVEMELGTPQGGVLSPFLFNVLMDKLISDIQLKPTDNIICYADDICLRSESVQDMQNLVTQLYESTLECGLVISIPKTKMMWPNDTFNNQVNIRGTALTTCATYKYLGVVVPLQDNYVSQLKDRLTKRLRPLKALAGRYAGANVKICRMFYLTYIRSLVDYHALHLITRPPRELQQLEKVQNDALRIILNCPRTTRIVNMLTELNITSLRDHICRTATLYGLKALHSTPEKYSSNNYGPVLYNIIQNRINGDANQRPTNPVTLCQSSNTHMTKISNEIAKLNIPISLQDHNYRRIPPWKLVEPQVIIPTCFPKKSKDIATAALQWKARESVSTVLGTLPAERQAIYTDGSLFRDTGKAGCAYVVYKDNCRVFADSEALPQWTCTTRSELVAILAATKYACSTTTNTLIVSDSKSALQSLLSPCPTHSDVVEQILTELYNCSEIGLTLKFTWIPSHIGITGNEAADTKAREAALTQTNEGNITQIYSLRHFKTLLNSEAKEAVRMRMNTQRSESMSIKHYDLFKDVKIDYGASRVYTGRCDRIAARIKLGYRRPWQINFETREGEPHPVYSQCVLCNEVGKHTLQHYITECTKLSVFRPSGLHFYELCLHFMKHETLTAIIGMYPVFHM